MSPPLKMKKEALDSAARSYSRSRAEHPRQRRCGNGPLEPVAEEGQGDNEVVLPVNPAANASANPPANAAANAAGNIANNAANAASAQPNVAANPRQNAGAQPPLVQPNHAEGSQLGMDPKHPNCVID
jgi:hypothetical protein